jgi:hypothetical protein
LKSSYVLTAALRNPKIGGLSLLGGKPDPVDWLQKNLDVDFPENAEILSIKLHGDESQTQDLIRVVDAVAKAYKDEVIDSERQRRLAIRDLLDRNLENLNADIKRKMDEFLDIAREMGRLDAGEAQVLQQLDTKRLDRVEEEIMRLESDLASNPGGDAAKTKSIQERIKQLHDQQADLEKKLTARAEKSTDLETRRRDVEQLQRVSDDVTMRLERLDYEARSPDRIRLMQPATISPD